MRIKIKSSIHQWINIACWHGLVKRGCGLGLPSAQVGLGCWLKVLGSWFGDVVNISLSHSIFFSLFFFPHLSRHHTLLFTSLYIHYLSLVYSYYLCILNTYIHAILMHAHSLCTQIFNLKYKSISWCWVTRGIVFFILS